MLLCETRGQTALPHCTKRKGKMTREMFQSPSPEEMSRLMAEAKRIQAEATRDLVRGAARVLRRAVTGVGRALVGWASSFEQARRAQTMYDELARMSDEQLAARGLSRAGISAAVSEAIFNDGAKAPVAVPAEEKAVDIHEPVQRPQPVRVKPQEEIREAA